jgi:hypothetical protein
MRSFGVNRTVAATLGTLALGFIPGSVSAQGCEPIRFVVPVNLGAEGEAYQPGREWRATLAYRRLLSNDWFIGTEQRDSLAPGGSSPVFEIHTAVVDLAYAFSDRYRARVSIPFPGALAHLAWAKQRRTRAASYLSAARRSLALRPRARAAATWHRLGVKAPTEPHEGEPFFTASGPGLPADP